MKSIEKLTDDLSDNKLTITIEEDEWNAVAHPDISSIDGTDAPPSSPFSFRTSGDPPSNERVGERVSEKFDEEVEEVYEIIEDSDDPLKEIMNMEL